MTNDRLPRLTAAEVIKALKRAGFSLARQSGSHKLYKDKEGKRVTVPYHSGRILHPKVLKSILQDAELTVKELKDLLE
jgi:predicted RNA binding protein YcfA (HicA-like mRNA interferase family)